jgi:hypothetical protein
MSNELLTPLQQIIQAAAAKNVVGPAARLRQRLDGASETRCAVVDCSGSMHDSLGSHGMTKMDQLMIALRHALERDPKLVIIAFASTSEVTTIDKLELHRGAHLGGGTDVAGALRVAEKLRPKRTLIISDGLPDNAPEAESVASRMKGAVDAIYCGPDSHPAVAWLRSLTKIGSGSTWTWDGFQGSLSEAVQLALPAPAEVK